MSIIRPREYYADESLTKFIIPEGCTEICEGAFATSSLSEIEFPNTLLFITYGNMHATQPCEYRLFFVDRKQQQISEKIQMRIAAGEEKQAAFLLHANISSEKICYLAIQTIDAEADALLQLLPFEVDMLFTMETLF